MFKSVPRLSLKVLKRGGLLLALAMFFLYPAAQFSGIHVNLIFDLFVPHFFVMAATAAMWIIDSNGPFRSFFKVFGVGLTAVWLVLLIFNIPHTAIYRGTDFVFRIGKQRVGIVKYGGWSSATIPRVQAEREHMSFVGDPCGQESFLSRIRSPREIRDALTSTPFIGGTGPTSPKHWGTPQSNVCYTELITDLPFWFFALPIALLTLILLVRDRFKNPLLCKTCHYDLRGNLSGICPECGVTIANRPHVGQRKNMLRLVGIHPGP